MSTSAEDTGCGRAPGPRRGTLRIYLGSAPGVGKTFAMLNEGRRRRERGTDVLVGFVETHRRRRTADQVADLPVVDRRVFEYRGAHFEEMEVDAVLTRAPEVALVDELAHANVPGSRNPKRWQDVQELLAAGIDVITTVNVQHLESLNDVIVGITGVEPQETIPDDVVRSADQIELVDITPEALRRRMAHGNIYGPEQIDAALANYFRAGNLGALRELALLWVADSVEESLGQYRSRYGITTPWETRERVLVAITGAPGSEHLIRRAARIAQRAHGDLLGISIQTDTGLVGPHAERLQEYRKLLEEVGGEYRAVTAGEVPSALVDFARAENCTQIVLGASRRSRWRELTQGSVINRVIGLSGPIDVHVISSEEDDGGTVRLPRSRRVLSAMPPRRQRWGLALTLVGLPLITLALANLREHIGLPGVLLLYLVFAMSVALVGGILPSMLAVVGGFVLANWYFTPPFHRLHISEAQNVLALLIYVAAAGIVAVLVDRAGRSRLDAARSRAEAEAMAALAGSLAEEEALPSLVAHLRTTFGMRSATLFRRDGGRWRVEATSGAPPPPDPSGADVVKELNQDLVLTLSGGELAVADHRVLAALAAQLAAAVEARRLRTQAGRAVALAEANDLRAALLQAVSHDLRTPLASIKASISSVRQEDVTWTPAQLAEFHATIEEEADRLDALVANLLDMSRLQAGALSVAVRTVGLEEVIPAAVASLGVRSHEVVNALPDDVAPVAADPALLERAVANLVGNAVTASPPGHPVRIDAVAAGGRVNIFVIDTGRGIPPADRELVFQPFQRLVDHGTGVGLGLAIARGFVEAMGGELSIEDTPGGGTTMIISLPRAAS